MLKGCSRRIIMVKDTGSRYFDSAYFVLKSDLPVTCRDSDMLSEARRMIAECADGSDAAPKEIKKRRRDFLPRLVIVVFSVLLVAAVLLALFVL